MRIIMVLIFVAAFQEGLSQRLVTGRVIDRNTREPVSDVAVTVYKGTSYMATNKNGYFQLTVQPGDSLLITHRDYLAGLIAIPEPDVFIVYIEKAISYPVYEKGITNLYEYLQQNLRYPNAALMKRLEGVLFMVVKVDATGSVIECQALNELGGNCEKIVSEVLLEIPGKWTPSDTTHSFIFPFVFKIADRESELSIPQIRLPEGKIMDQIIIKSYN